MKRFGLVVIALLVIGTDARGAAQHQGHQPPVPAPSPQAPAPECVTAAQNALSVIAGYRGARWRSPSARTPIELRRLAEELSVAARSAQAQLVPCAGTMGAEGADPERTPAPDRVRDSQTTRRRSAASHAPGDASGHSSKMDHSAMAPAGSAATAPTAKPAASDHSKMNMGSSGSERAAPQLPVIPAERIPDPACSGNDAASAARAAFNQKVYLFCSEQQRDEFRKDPAAYLKKHPRGE